jgi:hypothetical protein
MSDEWKLLPGFEIIAQIPEPDGYTIGKIVAQLIHERDEARAKAIEEAVAAIRHQKKVFWSPEYAGGPLGAIQEAFACDACEKAVAALERKP